MGKGWWSQRRLRTKIFLVFAPLLLGTLLLTLALTQLVVSRQAEDALKSQLRVTGDVFRGRLAERAGRLLAESTLLASDFALKRAVATYDPATLGSVAVNYRERLGGDLLWIGDDKGILLADARGAQQPGRSLRDFPPVAALLDGGRAAATVASVDGALYQLATVPVEAPGLIGFIVAGEGIDDDTAELLRRQTGSQVSFLTSSRVFASSLAAAERRRLSPAALVATAAATAESAPFLAESAGERWLSLLVPIGAVPEPLYALVQRSYDRALEPLLALRRRFVIIGVAALAGALLIGAVLANGIAAPLQAMVGVMRQVRSGDLRQRLALRREDEIGYLASSFNEMVAGLEERERIKDTFGRYVSRDVAEAVLSGRVPLRGELREVTILFQDIRGFTSLTEKSNPEELVGILNRFFTEMVAAVEAQGGVVRQFTGDGVMAMFGAPVTHADDPPRAVRAGLDMLHRLEALNRRLEGEGWPPLRIGIGIHTGDVVAGQLGPDERIEYSVIGDAVNVASRIESLTKEMGATLLVSQVTAARLGGEFRLGRRVVLPIRGKEQPVEIVEVVG